MGDTSREQKRRRFLRQSGRPPSVTGADFDRAVARARQLHAQDMTLVQMSELTGVNKRTLARILSGESNSMRRANWLGIMSARFDGELDGRRVVSAVGTVRRLDALWADGFPLQWLVDESGFGNLQHVQKLVGGEYEGVEVRNRQAVADLYDRLDGKTPQDVGIPPGRSKWVKGWAVKRNAVPRHCWDPDTLDDPEAIPEWTGACGTPRGARIHQREGIPMCPACESPDRDVAVGFQARRFAEMRLERGWSQRQAARELGTDRSTLAHWETGHSAPRPENMASILAVFGCAREDLIKEE